MLTTDRETLFFVTLPGSVFGVVVVRGQVVDAAPIARWTVGKPWVTARNWFTAKHGNVTKVSTCR